LSSEKVSAKQSKTVVLPDKMESFTTSKDYQRLVQYGLTDTREGKSSILLPKLAKPLNY
jgi:hypothetical protein